MFEISEKSSKISVFVFYRSSRHHHQFDCTGFRIDLVKGAKISSYQTINPFLCTATHTKTKQTMEVSTLPSACRKYCAKTLTSSNNRVKRTVSDAPHSVYSRGTNLQFALIFGWKSADISKWFSFWLRDPFCNSFTIHVQFAQFA